MKKRILTEENQIEELLVKSIDELLKDDNDGLSLVAIGIKYEKALGVELNYQEAINYYKKAVEKNVSALAVYNLAEMYRLGKGVDQSLDKAVNLYYYLVDKMSDTDWLETTTPKKDALLRIAELYESGYDSLSVELNDEYKYLKDLFLRKHGIVDENDDSFVRVRRTQRGDMEYAISEVYFRYTNLDGAYDKAVLWAKEAIKDNCKAIKLAHEILIFIYMDNNWHGASLEEAIYWYNNYSACKKERSESSKDNYGHELFSAKFSLSKREIYREIRTRINEKLTELGIITQEEKEAESKFSEKDEGTFSFKEF